MDDALLVGVLDRAADLHEQTEALSGGEIELIAVVGDSGPFDQLHHKVRPSHFGGASLQHFGNVGMVHQRQRLPLRLETGDDLAGVHAQFNDLERDEPVNGLGLLRPVNHAIAALSDALD